MQAAERFSAARGDVPKAILTTYDICSIIEFITQHIKRISSCNHIAVWQSMQGICHNVSVGIYDKGFRRCSVIIATRGDIDIAICILHHSVQVYPYLHSFNYLKTLQIYDKDPVVVVWHPVSTRIGHIEFAVAYNHIFRLITHRTLRYHFKRGRIDFGNIPQTGIGVYLHRTGIRCNIGISAFKLYIPAVGNRDSCNVLCCL